MERAHRIANEVKIDFQKFYVIGGYRYPEKLEDHAQKALQFEYLGKIAHDETVEEYIFTGQSLLELPSDSPAYTSIKKIMKTAGYIQQ